MIGQRLSSSLTTCVCRSASLALHPRHPIPTNRFSDKYLSKNIIIRSITDVVSGSSVGQGVEDRTFVTGYGDHAFQVNDCLVRDSVVLLPESYFIWKARTFDEITLDSLSVFTGLFPTIEMVLIGCGDRVPAMLDPNIVTEMRNKGIVIELMNSSSALTTFNVLNSEGRNVGAAILPIKGYNPIDGQESGIDGSGSGSEGVEEEIKVLK